MSDQHATNNEQVKQALANASNQAAFESELHQIQGVMRHRDAQASKVIHGPGVEMAGITINGIIARPMAVFMGGLVSLVGIIYLALLSNRDGFNVSGVTIILLFVFGWFAGTIVDLLYRSIRAPKF